MQRGGEENEGGMSSSREWSAESRIKRYSRMGQQERRE